MLNTNLLQRKTSSNLQCFYLFSLIINKQRKKKKKEKSNVKVMGYFDLQQSGPWAHLKATPFLVLHFKYAFLPICISKISKQHNLNSSPKHPLIIFFQGDKFMFYFNLAQLIFVIFIYVLVALHVFLLIWVNLAQLILSSFFSRQFWLWHFQKYQSAYSN